MKPKLGPGRSVGVSCALSTTKHPDQGTSSLRNLLVVPFQNDVLTVAAYTPFKDPQTRITLFFFFPGF